MLHPSTRKTPSSLRESGKFRRRAASMASGNHGRTVSRSSRKKSYGTRNLRRKSRPCRESGDHTGWEGGLSTYCVYQNDLVGSARGAVFRDAPLALFLFGGDFPREVCVREGKSVRESAGELGGRGGRGEDGGREEEEEEEGCLPLQQAARTP